MLQSSLSHCNNVLFPSAPYPDRLHKQGLGKALPNKYLTKGTKNAEAYFCDTGRYLLSPFLRAYFAFNQNPLFLFCETMPVQRGQMNQQKRFQLKPPNDNLLNAAEETLAILPPFSYNTGEEVASSRNSTCF